MKKFVPFLTLALILGFALDLRGQNITATNVTTQTITLPASDAVPQVTSFFGSSAVFGTTPYYYWFVSRTGSNVSPPAGPLVVQAPASLSSLNNISITWTPIGGGVTSYDVLRTATSATPSGACGCAVALATTLAKVIDSGAALQAYTVSAVGSNWTIQNKLNAGVQALMAFYQGTAYQIAPGSSSTAACNTNEICASPNCPVVATANCYFVNDNGKYCLDATVTATSPTVTSAGQCQWTAADVGKLFFATNKAAFGQSASSKDLFPVGTTISAFNSPTNITVSQNASTSCTPANPSNPCIAVYGTDDTANLNAAWAATGSNGGCNSLHLPAGAMLFTPPLFTVVPSGTACTYLTATVPYLGALQNTTVSIYGSGVMSTGLVPEPVASGTLASLCTGGASANVCIGGIAGVQFHDLSINGFGQNQLGSNAVNLFRLANEGLPTWNLAFLDWDAGDTSTSNIGVNVNSYSYLGGAIVEGFGRVGGTCGTAPCWASNNWFNGGCIGFEVSAGTPAQPTFTQFNLYYVGLPGTGQGCAGAGLYNEGFYLMSSADYVFDQDATASHNDVLNGISGAFSQFTNLNIDGNNQTGSVAVNNVAGATIHCYACKLGAAQPTGLNNAGTFYDDGANTFALAGTPYAGSGSYIGPPIPSIDSFTNATIASNISVTANTVTTLMTATPTLPFIGGSYRATINYSVYIVGGTIGMSWLSDGTHTGGMSYCGTVSNNFSFCSGSWTTPVQYTGSNPTFTLLFIDSGTATACSSVLSGGSCGAVSGLSNIVNVPASMQISLVQSN